MIFLSFEHLRELSFPFLALSICALSAHLQYSGYLKHYFVELKKGDPEMKFSRLFLSAVRRPPIRPTTKNFSWNCPCPSFDVRPGVNWVLTQKIHFLLQICFFFAFFQILYDVWTSYRIDPTALASDIGRRNVRRSF